MKLSHCYWHLVVKNGNLTLLLGSRWSRMAISHSYWHLVIKNGNFITTSNVIRMVECHLVVKNANFTLLLTSSDHKCQFHIITDIWWSRMTISIPTDIQWSTLAISHSYWHLVIKEWQFHTTSNVIRIIECHLVVKNGNFPLLLTSSGQEWQFHNATDIY